jgi:hypothetical protein
MARTDAAQTFTGTQTYSGQIVSSLAIGTAPFSITSTTNVPNLNASSLNGATFAVPGAIGGTTPAAITGTTIDAQTQLNMGAGSGVLLCSATAPTISSGFGSGASIVASNGTCAFQINVGTGGVATSGVIGLPAATTGWVCQAEDITTESATVARTKQTASATNTATVGNFNTTPAAAAWVASDKLNVSCKGY